MPAIVATIRGGYKPRTGLARMRLARRLALSKQQTIQNTKRQRVRSEHQAPASASAWSRSLALRVLMSFRAGRLQSRPANAAVKSNRGPFLGSRGMACGGN